MQAAKTRTMRLLASRRSRAVFGTAALLVIVGSFGFWLRTSSLVRVKQVTVTGIEGRQAGAIRDSLTIAARDMTTLAVDDNALRDAVSAYPVVRSLRASADFPHRLRIDVNAYEPVAAVQSGGGSPTAVASDGTLLRGTTTKSLPVVGIKHMPGGGRVKDEKVLRAIRLVAAAPAPLRRRVERVYRRSARSRRHRRRRAQALLRTRRAPAGDVVGGRARPGDRQRARRDVRRRAHSRESGCGRLPASPDWSLTFDFRLMARKAHFSCTSRESRILQAKLRE